MSESFASAAMLSEEKGSIAYLLNGHHHLNGVQAVKAEVVGEVRDAVNLKSKKRVNRRDRPQVPPIARS